MQLAISIDQSKSESVRTVNLIGRVRALTNVGLRLELSEKSGILPVHADPVVQRFWDGSLVIVSHLFLLIHLLRPAKALSVERIPLHISCTGCRFIPLPATH